MFLNILLSFVKLAIFFHHDIDIFLSKIYSYKEEVDNLGDDKNGFGALK